MARKIILAVGIFFMLFSTATLSHAGPAKGPVKGPVKKSQEPKMGRMLTLREITKLSGEAQYQYFSILQKSTIKLQAGMKMKPARKTSKNAWFNWLLTEAKAAAADYCFPGGYLHALNEAGECVYGEKPEWDELRDEAGNVIAGQSLTSECGTAENGQKKLWCDSSLYLFNENKDRFCVATTVENWAHACHRASNNYYGPGLLRKSDGSLQGDPAFPKRITEALKDLVAQGPKNQLAFDSKLLSRYRAIGAVEATPGISEQRAAEARAMRKQISLLICSQIKTNPDRLLSGPVSHKLYDPVNGNFDTVTTELREQWSVEACKAFEATPEAKAMAAATAADPATETKPAEETAENTAATSSTLGELSCVMDGIKKSGAGKRTPSERYIAMLGAGAQTHNSFNVADPASLKAYRLYVISMVESFGYCDNCTSKKPDDKTCPQFPALKDTEKHALKNWISRKPDWDGFGSTGMQYHAQTGATVDDPNVGATLLCARFKVVGEKGDCSVSPENVAAITSKWDGLFKIDHDKFRNLSLQDRQKRLLDWLGPKESIKPDSCWADLHQRASGEKDQAFNIKEIVNINSVENGDAAKTVRAKNFELCKAMAESCKIDPKEACFFATDKPTGAPPVPAATTSNVQ